VCRRCNDDVSEQPISAVANGGASKHPPSSLFESAMLIANPQPEIARESVAKDRRLDFKRDADGVENASCSEEIRC
jgi:hypothetical protein